MSENPLRQLGAHGQSVWLDYISRDLIRSGGLQRLVDRVGLRGVTSNPTIFQRAISGSDIYDAEIARLAKTEDGFDRVFEALAVEDIREACDVLRSVYDDAGGADGFVSLEVSPHLADDTAGTLDEARRLAADVNRPNLLIKVPATPEGLPAIEQLLTEGINVNITLIFAQTVYAAVAEAYLKALETREVRGEPLDRVASVASTFVSRIDTAVDAKLEQVIAQNPERSAELKALLGKAAVANSKAVYQRFLDIFASERFKRLAAKGAHRQRPLWASTSTKNPAYPETLYVDELIGADTVNTMPEPTMNAFAEHGEVQETVTAGLEYWLGILDALADAGIDLDDVMQDLQGEGVQKFQDSYDELVRDLTTKAAALAG